MFAPHVHARRLALPVGSLHAFVGLQRVSAWHRLAGEVEFARGVGFAQTPGQALAPWARGWNSRRRPPDHRRRCSAIIKLADGTRMTVRPNSELVLSQYQFKENATRQQHAHAAGAGRFPRCHRPDFQELAERSPGSDQHRHHRHPRAPISTHACTQDCGTESSKVTETPVPMKCWPVPRWSRPRERSTRGRCRAASRRLVDGGSIYPGDLVETGAGTRAVLAFRDESRLTLGSGTRFRVDNFVFDEKNA
jgi:hypothetical protein